MNRLRSTSSISIRLRCSVVTSSAAPGRLFSLQASQSHYTCLCLRPCVCSSLLQYCHLLPCPALCLSGSHRIPWNSSTVIPISLRQFHCWIITNQDRWPPSPSTSLPPHPHPRPLTSTSTISSNAAPGPAETPAPFLSSASSSSSAWVLFCCLSIGNWWHGKRPGRHMRWNKWDTTVIPLFFGVGTINQKRFLGHRLCFFNHSC